MKVTSSWELPVYQVIGPVVRIHWNYQEIPATDETPAMWSCEEAIVPVNADRGAVISAIIRARYGIDEEFAAINNGGEDYAEFLAFRDKAKALANNWFAQ
jgi:hypothetical protein